MYVILHVFLGVYWTGTGWSKDRAEAARFDSMFAAHLECRRHDRGIGLRVETA